MKKLLLAALVSMAFAFPAIAAQCPKDMKKIDEALAKNPNITTEQMAEVTKMRAEGEAMHKGGQHKDSVKTLHKAMEILGIK
jgi:hypothetical protein